MSRVVPMLLFALMFLAVIGGIHFYIWVRLVRDAALATPWRQVATFAIIALGVSIPLTMFLSRGFAFESVRHLTWLPYVWLGAMMLFTFFFLAVDVARLVAFAVAKLSGGEPLGADPARRVLLGRAVAGVALASVIGLSCLAVYNASKRAALERVEVALARLPASLEGLTIVQISDLHVGIAEGEEWLAGVVRRVNELEPDVVAITGDLIDGMVPQLGRHIAPLSDLRARYGVYFVTGNHEYYFGVDDWIAEVEKNGVRVLRNEGVEIGEGEERLYLVGVDDPEGARMAPGHGQNLGRALDGRVPDQEVVLLAHQPGVIHQAASRDVGLVLSGHTHGGQIWPFTYLVSMAQPYNKGLHRHGARTQIYVNQGTGFWGPPMRLGSRNEITELTLTRAESWRTEAGSAKGGEEMTTRKVTQVLKSRPTMEGAGVSLRRVFGFAEEGDFDPFLLLDDFGSEDPDEYLAGFPWHPHRGIETITYVLHGDVEHGDSLGNSGTIGAGDVQWMTAGGGIIHQEMPKGDGAGRMAGFQLWANLPAKQKMMKPRYRDVPADTIPEVVLEGGVRVKVVAGKVGEVEGPVGDIVIEPEYLDVTVPAGQRFTHPVKAGHTAFAYVFEGEAGFGDGAAESVSVTRHHLARFGDGDEIAAVAGGEGARFLLVSGKPLGEPIAWRGPIVMNTDEELQLAFDEYRDGTFIR